ncbi:MAG: M14 family zinc carboxypeptidase, partial [Planctomycetota bacterium]
MSLAIIQQKMKPYWFMLVTISLLTIQTGTARPATYYDYKSLRKHLVSLAKQDPNLVRVDSIAQSIDKRKVWIAEVGKGAEDDRKIRPAILVVAGIEGNDLTGSSIAVSWLAQLTKQYRTDNKIAELLETTTIYIIPRLNPDAAEHFFIEPKLETSANSKPVDDDHDGLVDEDAPEDLNEDGL